MNASEEWEKVRRKIWERELRGYDEDACEQVLEEPQLAEETKEHAW